MRKIVLVFGLISGLIFVIEMAIVLPLSHGGKLDFDKSEIVGYTTMVLSFTLVFFGIRSYRENSGGTITFGKAFLVGLLITLVSCAVYVGTWEVIYFRLTPEFYDQYLEHSLKKMRAEGKSDTEILAQRQKMTELKKYYDNPVINAGMTLMEVLPVGLVMTLISAAILRRKTVPPPAEGAVAY